MMLGSHMSIAGGYFKAVEAARDAGCDCVQLFTKNNNQWRAKPITPEDVTLFQDALDSTGIKAPLSHASYLINLATPDDTLRAKSVAALAHELERAALLGIPNVVVHPGAFTTSTEGEGIVAIIDSIKSVLKATKSLPTRLLLENTAGQGTNLGWQFEQLAAMIDGVRVMQERLGVCVDTCHAFAAGYNLSDPTGFRAMVRSMKDTFGIERIHAIHLNDSKKPLGSRVDRHEHIGDGAIGLEGFRLLLNHSQLKRIPMYLETEKGESPEGRDWDVVNLERLRALVK